MSILPCEFKQLSPPSITVFLLPVHNILGFTRGNQMIWDNDTSTGSTDLTLNSTSPDEATARNSEKPLVSFVNTPEGE